MAPLPRVQRSILPLALIDAFADVHGATERTEERPFRLAVATARGGGLSVSALTGYVSMPEARAAKLEYDRLCALRAAELRKLPSLWDGHLSRERRRLAGSVERIVVHDERDRTNYTLEGVHLTHDLATHRDSMRLSPERMGERPTELELSL